MASFKNLLRKKIFEGFYSQNCQNLVASLKNLPNHHPLRQGRERHHGEVAADGASERAALPELRGQVRAPDRAAKPDREADGDRAGDARDDHREEHVPAVAVAVPRAGREVELAVRDAVHGRPVKNTDALANPEALQHFRDLEELLAP